MKAKITGVKFHKEITTKFGVMYSFYVSYDDKQAQFLSKYKDQKKFIEGQEAEFDETEKEYNGKTYYQIKPVVRNGNFAKQMKKEQSRYSGFAASYAKDLCVAGKIELKDLRKVTKTFFELMVDLDATLEK